MAKRTRRKSPQLDSDYDGAWKESLRQHFREILGKYFPAISAAMDWSHSPEWSDKELSRILGRAKRRPKTVDVLAKVRLMDCEDAAAEVEYSLSDWQALTDQSLLARARLLIDHLNTALTADAATLAKYDLTPASLASLQKEFNDYDQIVNAPQEAKTGGKALNKELRPKFRGITRHLIRMDKLVHRFRHTPAGQSFATAYTAARNIHDRGKGPSTPSAPQPG
jgi:hypothetical protein